MRAMQTTSTAEFSCCPGPMTSHVTTNTHLSPSCCPPTAPPTCVVLSHTQLSRQLLSGPEAPPSTAGQLADTLHLLAVGLQDAPDDTRQDLCFKLLLLFSNVAARLGPKSAVVKADLADLLVAVAVAAEGLQPRTLRLLSSTSSSSRMDIHDIKVSGLVKVWW